MTVCISTIAAKSQAIVMVADKALTYRDGGGRSPAMQFDTGIRKILPIGNSGWYVLIAGDASFAGDVIEQAKSELDRSPSLRSVRVMMSCMKTAYQRCRESAVTDNILSPNLLNKRLLVARPQSLLPLPSSHYEDVIEDVQGFDAGTSLLVCGFDDERKPKPHIFSVLDPGIYENHDLAGVHAIGIGQDTAMARLLQMETDKRDDLSKALYEAFDAKASAEIIQGVGLDWDAEILLAGKGKSVRVPNSIMNLVGSVYDAFPQSPFSHVGTQPKDWCQRLGKFAKKLIPTSPVPDAIRYRMRKKKKKKRS